MYLRKKRIHEISNPAYILEGLTTWKHCLRKALYVLHATNLVMCVYP